MCLVRYRPKLGRRQGAMCLHTFRMIVDDLPNLRRLTLQGLGEPLLAPDIFDMIDYGARRGISMGFNTNGTLLSRQRAERLVVAGLDWLHVSLDGATAETYESIRQGARFDRVTENIAGLVEVMRGLEAGRPSLSIVFVAMRRNIRELPQLTRLTGSWGIPKLWVQNLSHSFNDTDPAGSYREIRHFAETEALWAEGDPETEAIFEESRSVAKEVGVELRLPRLEEPPSTRRPGTPGCHWPFESGYITHDGAVQPCCMVMGADRAVLGRVNETGFAKVWHGEEYAEFRAALLTDDPPDVCSGCSLYRRLF